MSDRTPFRWAALACAAVLSTAESRPARAQDATEPPRVVLRLREVVDAVGNDGPDTGRFRLRLVVTGADTEFLEDLGLVLGDASFFVPLTGGTFSGRLLGSAGDVRASVLARRGRVHARIRGRMRDGVGTVYGARAFAAGADAGRWDGGVYGIEEATLQLGLVSHPVAVGLAGESKWRRGVRIAFSRGSLQDDPFRVSLAGIGRDVATRRGRADVQFVPPDPLRRWDGRLRGHAFSVSGATPALALALDGDPGRAVVPTDGEAVDLGGTTRVSDGVVSRDVGGRTVVQARFDVAVPARSGSHTATVGARIEDGPPVRAVRPFTAPENDPPAVLDVDEHALEVRGDGRIRAWGDNNFGQVGDGTEKPVRGLIELSGPSDVVSVGAGREFSLAADVRGTTWLWGRYDQKSGNYGSFPAPFGGLPEVVSVAAGAQHGLALDRQGRVWSFGANGSGQLGDGTLRNRWRDPEVVGGLPPVVAIAAGENTSLVLDGDGRAWTWGDQNLAGLDDGRRPTRVRGLPALRAVAASGSDLRSAAVVLGQDGTVWTWGGDDPEDAFPSRVGDLDDVVAVSCGDRHDLALAADGSVWVWGSNTLGEFGDGTRTSSETPVRVPGLGPIVRIAAGHNVSFAVDADGACWVFGRTIEFLGGWGTITKPVLAPR